MITIRNLSKRTVVLNLAHEHACSPTVCTCGRQKVGVQEHDPKTGDRVVRKVNQRIPASVTLFPKGTRETVPGPVGDDGKPGPPVVMKLDEARDLLDNVARLPLVKKHVDDGTLKVEPQPQAAEPAATPPTPKGDQKPSGDKPTTTPIVTT